MHNEVSRKIAEKLGWKWHDYSCLAHSLHGIPPSKDAARDYCGGDPVAPDFLSPATFWPEFEKWLKSNSQDFETRFCNGFQPTGKFQYGFRIYPCGQRDNGEAFTGGNTYLEAGCRAWLAALESK